MTTPVSAPPPYLIRIQRELRRARDYLDAGNTSAARAVSESLTQQFPKLGLGWFYRSLAEAADGRLPAAVASAEKAAAVEPERPEILAHLARCQMLRSEAHAALQAARKAATLTLEEAPLIDRVASVLTHFGDAEAALPLFERAIAIDAANPMIHFNYGTAFRVLGRRGEALVQFERALELAPGLALAHWAIADLDQWTDDCNHVERMEATRPLLAEGAEPLALLDFALFKELDQLGRHGPAADALDRGNRIMRERLRFDSKWEAELFSTLEKHADGLFGSIPVEVAAAPGDAPVPIFVLGMPRSGATLVERLLGNHPEVRLGGDLQDFNVCIKRELGIETGAFMEQRIASRLGEIDWKRVGDAYRSRLRERFGPGGYVTDKMPGNSFYVHAIAAALPEARIVHVVRDPLDTCFSIWNDVFGAIFPYAYDQEAIAAHCIRHAGWMRRCESALPKRIFPLRYEQMVSVPGLVTKALYRFCGLDWVDGAEDPTGNDKPVATAGAVLVRERIHGRGVGAWRPYAEHVSPMRERLIEAGLMSRD
ncbi:MAG TPA: sulfotransferase [Patescibacteria group bacterium]|nr:sulfotransferase [Patescibacteria group bacterium]